MKPKKYPVVLSIAGSDCSAGAGIQADLKSAAACGAYCLTAITAVTAQNTQGVRGIEIVSDDMIRAQLNALTDDIAVDAVKLGMLPSAGAVELSAETIERWGCGSVVLDPVMVSTSGHMLVAPEVAQRIVERLLPLALLATPNIPEAEFISGERIVSEADFGKAARRFEALGCRALLLKGGHLKQAELTDTLFDFRTGETRKFTFPKTDTPNTHGTGCSLSSAIAALLAQGSPLTEAVERAEAYLHRALEAGAAYALGSGHGPIDHFFTLRKEQ